MVLPTRRQLAAAADVVRQRFATKPRLGIVLGSGLGSFAEELQRAEVIPYSEIPGVPASAVVGHAGNLCLGYVDQQAVACLQGRVHAYEGHPIEQVVFGVCLLAELGCEFVVLTNAAGGIDSKLAPGELMLITDHINLTGTNPLVGPVGPGLERFVDMTEAYDADVRAAAQRAASAAGVPLAEGVYAGLLGPTYETPAEIRMLRTLGASAVGMSTVLEVIALRQLRVRVGAVSCITNLAAGISPKHLDHAEVQATANLVREHFVELLLAWFAELAAL